MNYNFKAKNPDVNKRREISEKYNLNFPDRVPLICEKDPKSNLNDIEKKEFLAPKDLTLAMFSDNIRRR